MNYFNYFIIIYCQLINSGNYFKQAQKTFLSQFNYFNQFLFIENTFKTDFIIN